MSIQELEELMSKNGDVKLSELISKLKGNKIHKCPKCEGKGFLLIKYNAYPSGLPDSGWVEDYKYKKEDCSICNAFGYTEKEFKPIIKTTIEGYE